VCSLYLALTVAGCQTTAPVTANNRHPESNYGRVAADYAKTRLLYRSAVPAFEPRKSPILQNWNGCDPVG
jgi:hypothetical protein